MNTVLVSQAICRQSECPCLGGVCVHSGDLMEDVFCPRQSGCIEEFVMRRLKESAISDERYEWGTERVLANPEAYPRLYSGDGKHYGPMNPEWKNEKVLHKRKITFLEACDALRRYEEGLPPEVDVL